MSIETSNTSELVIDGTAAAVLEVLTDLERLPAWNPAFTHVGPAREDGVHRLTVQHVLNGTIRATVNDGHESAFAEFDIAIPGLRERSVFMVEPHSNETTRVIHRVEQRGPLAAVIGRREATLVPGKRLARLANVVEGRDPHAARAV